VAATPCPDLEPLLERFADGECASDDSLRVREHLAACPPCRRALRAITELNRRVAQSPTPPTPPDLEARLRQAIRADGRRRRFRAWIPAAAAAVALIAAAAFLLRSSGASTPPFIAGSAFFHGRYLAGTLSFLPNHADRLRGYFREVLDAEVVLPKFDDSICKGKGCKGGCPCADEPGAVPWILYSYDNTAISLIIAPPGAVLHPGGSRRSHEGRDYHVFEVKGATVLVREAGGRNHLWVARLPESELLGSVLKTTEGRDAFLGTPVSVRDLLCRECCGPMRQGLVTGSARIWITQLIAVGKKGIDLDRFIREGQKP